MRRVLKCFLISIGSIFCFFLTMGLIRDFIDDFIYTKPLGKTGYYLVYWDPAWIVQLVAKSSRFSSVAYIIIDEEVKEVYWNNRFIIAKSNIEGDKKWYIVEFGPGGGPCVVHTYSDYDQFIGAGRSFSLDTLKMEHLVWKD